MFTCYITLPNKQFHEIEFDPKQIGQVILDKVLDVLGIIEVDFFGLQYNGSKKEELWLNLRNRVCDQIIGSSHVYRLKLRVKFFVEPQYIQQESTKDLFYVQAKEAISKGHISLTEPHCDECKLAKLVAYITQAEHGDLTCNSYQRHTYEEILKELYPTYIPSQTLIDRVLWEHSNLHGMPRASSRYFMLQIVSELPGYGMEVHKVHTAQGFDVNFGVGPEGLVLQNAKTKEERTIPYLQISLATHNDKSVHVQLIDEAGEPQIEECYKLVSRKAAIALYRCITEMHSFYRCDTVCPDVQSQYCRDFKGTFVSIFNENSELGKRYIFDIQRTSREAYDCVRRKLYAKSSSPNCSPVHNFHSCGSCVDEDEEEEDEDVERNEEEKESVVNDVAGDLIQQKQNTNLQKEVKSLKRRLEVLEDSLLCCICMYQKVCMVLCPCGHMTCDMCCERIEECPLCRTDIDRFQKVFQGFGSNANTVCDSIPHVQTDL
ncbi:E3 ubiquitin-protein ligase MYLIP [Aplysia californica]|uniref:E3 ubiquitin-protein ligase MYLIP n=1 Tax=Aplysia californica TaxID=6500 RepID=A0ABM0K138_APLCA|nr:E3 ubiquitin-protein ligase MYLIP [Aplysia californica]